MNFTKTAILAATLLATSQAALAHRTIEFSNRCNVTAHVDIVYLDHDGRTRDASYTLRPRSGDTGLLNAQGKRIRTNSRSLWFKARAGSKVWSSDGMGSGYRFYRDTWDRIDIDLKCRPDSNYDSDAPRPDLRRSGAGGGGSPNSPWKILETDLGQLLQSIGTSSTAINGMWQVALPQPRNGRRRFSRRLRCRCGRRRHLRRHLRRSDARGVHRGRQHPRRRRRRLCGRGDSGRLRRLGPVRRRGLGDSLQARRGLEPAVGPRSGAESTQKRPAPGGVFRRLRALRRRQQIVQAIIRRDRFDGGQGGKGRVGALRGPFGRSVQHPRTRTVQCMDSLIARRERPSRIRGLRGLGFSIRNCRAASRFTASRGTRVQKRPFRATLAQFARYPTKHSQHREDMFMRSTTAIALLLAAAITTAATEANLSSARRPTRSTASTADEIDHLHRI